MRRFAWLVMVACAVTTVACSVGALPGRDAAPPGDDAGGATGTDASDAGDGTGVADATDATDAIDAIDATDVSTDVAPSICSSGQSVAPVATIATYSQWDGYCNGSSGFTFCDNPAFVERLLACDGVAMRTGFPSGSDVLQVAERRATTCVIKFWEDIEASDSYWTCEVPLPLMPWPGLGRTGNQFTSPTEGVLKGIESYCTQVGRCCLSPLLCAPGCDPTFVNAPAVTCN